MTLFSLLSVLGCVAPAAAEEVASVMVVQGEAVILPAGGAARPAVVGATLQRTDTVVTAEGALLVLHLKNEQLVRIDEDLELRVDRIVVLNAPARPLNAQAQLAQLIDPSERSAIPGLDQAERVAGWHARLTAAQAPGATTRSAPAAAPPSAAAAPAPAPESDAAAPRAPAPSGGGAPGMAMPPAPPPSPAPAPAPAADAPAAKMAAEAARRKASESQRLAPKAKPSAVAAAAPPPPPAPPRVIRLEEVAIEGHIDDDASGGGAVGGTPKAWTRTEFEAHFSTELGTCLADWAASLPVKVEAVEVTVRVDTSVVDRLIFDGGLTPPACAREAAVGALLADIDALGEPRFTFRVVIP